MGSDKKTIIYVVTSGVYSDYGIEGVFSTREMAEEAAVLYSDEFNEARVEEHCLDEVPDHPKGLVPWMVSFDIDGNSEAERRALPMNFDCSVIPQIGGGGRMMTKVWARDEQRAIKIANERRIATIAAGEWETSYLMWLTKKHGGDQMGSRP